MRNTRQFACLLAAVLLLHAAASQARSWSYRDPHDHAPRHVEEYEWQEQEAELPAFPKEESLLALPIQRPDSRHRFLIDPETLAVGEDGVVRYTLVMRSLSGGRNVMYEGIHCTEKAYKTFAYGTRDNQLRALSKPK